MNWNKLFAYTSFIGALGTIFDVTYTYLFADNKTSFGLTESSGIQIIIIMILMMLSAYFLYKEKENSSFLVIAGYLYGLLSFVIYIITAAQYTWGNKEISNFSLEILIVFVTTLIASIIIFLKLDDKKNFEKLSRLFMIGLLIVIAMLIFNFMVLRKTEISVFQVVIFMAGGIGLFTLLSFLAKTPLQKVPLPKQTSRRKKTLGDDTKW